MPTPVGELETFGIGPESVFGTPAVPVLFHAMETFTEGQKNTFNPRTGVRGSPSEAPGSTGPFDGSVSFRPEATPDTIGQLFAYAMGTQSVPAAFMGSTSAKTSSLTFGKRLALPSFTIQRNRYPIDVVNYFGCVVDTLKIALDSGKNLAVDVSAVTLGEIEVMTPTSPTFSTKFPLTMEASQGAVSFAGATIGTGPNPPAVTKWDMTLNNQLVKTYRSVGTRFVYGFPLGMRKVSGNMTLGYENQTGKTQFWGGATGPNAVVAGVPIVLTVSGQDVIDATNQINYRLIVTMPNCQITADPINATPSGPLMQNVTWEAKDSVPGAGDALSMTLINTATAVY